MLDLFIGRRYSKVTRKEKHTLTWIRTRGARVQYGFHVSVSGLTKVSRYEV